MSQGAADSGATALGQGAAKVPETWRPGIANYQQVDHVVVREGGRILGRDGNPIVGSLQKNPEAHTPLSDWLNLASWNKP
jgi:hypothetical protein